MYANKSGKGGHPNVDVILMFKIQLLEVWYNLSDLAVEREIYDRLSFWHFLWCPDKIPDNSTIWLFRERMSESGVDTLVWQEFQRQLDLKGLKIEQGMIQDATFVYAEPGHCKKDTPRGEQAKCTMAINFIPSWIRRMILFDALKPPRKMFMTVRWICQKKEKWSIGIGDIREQNARDIVPQ